MSPPTPVFFLFFFWLVDVGRSFYMLEDSEAVSVWLRVTIKLTLT